MGGSPNADAAPFHSVAINGFHISFLLDTLTKLSDVQPQIFSLLLQLVGRKFPTAGEQSVMHGPILPLFACAAGRHGRVDTRPADCSGEVPINKSEVAGLDEFRIEQRPGFLEKLFAEPTGEIGIFQKGDGSLLISTDSIVFAKQERIILATCRECGQQEYRKCVEESSRQSVLIQLP